MSSEDGIGILVPGVGLDTRGVGQGMRCNFLWQSVRADQALGTPGLMLLRVLIHAEETRVPRAVGHWPWVPGLMGLV